MNKITLLIIAVGLALVGVIADSFIKIAGKGPKFIDWRWFVLGSVVYISTIFGWFYVLKYLKLTTIGVYYSVSILLSLVIVGTFYFKESLNVYEIIGVITAIASIILLGRFA